jgi:hypothetical protein
VCRLQLKLDTMQFEPGQEHRHFIQACITTVLDAIAQTNKESLDLCICMWILGLGLRVMSLIPTTAAALQCPERAQIQS